MWVIAANVRILCLLIIRTNELGVWPWSKIRHRFHRTATKVVLEPLPSEFAGAWSNIESNFGIFGKILESTVSHQHKNFVHSEIVVWKFGLLYTCQLSYRNRKNQLFGGTVRKWNSCKSLKLKRPPKDGAVLPQKEKAARGSSGERCVGFPWALQAVARGLTSAKARGAYENWTFLFEKG